MQVTPALAIAALLVLAGASSAESYLVLLDERSDQRLGLVGGGSLEPTFRLREPCVGDAGDILQASLAATDSELVLSISVVSLADLRIGCGGFTANARSAEYAFTLSGLDSGDPLVANFDLDARAETTGFGMEGCILLNYVDAQSLECLGSLARDGDTLTWRIPIAGVDHVQVFSESITVSSTEEDRAYDLRGVDFEPRASTSMDLAEGGLPATSLNDEITGPVLTL